MKKPTALGTVLALTTAACATGSVVVTFYTAGATQMIMGGLAVAFGAATLFLARSLLSR